MQRATNPHQLLTQRSLQSARAGGGKQSVGTAGRTFASFSALSASFARASADAATTLSRSISDLSLSCEKAANHQVQLTASPKSSVVACRDD